MSIKIIKFSSFSLKKHPMSTRASLESGLHGIKNTPKIKTRRRGVLSVSDLRNDMKQQGLDISFINENGKTQLYSKKELIAIYKDNEKNRGEKHKEEKLPKLNLYAHVKSPVQTK